MSCAMFAEIMWVGKYEIHYTVCRLSCAVKLTSSNLSHWLHFFSRRRRLTESPFGAMYFEVNIEGEIDELLLTENLRIGSGSKQTPKAWTENSILWGLPAMTPPPTYSVAAGFSPRVFCSLIPCRGWESLVLG